MQPYLYSRTEEQGKVCEMITETCNRGAILLCSTPFIIPPPFTLAAQSGEKIK